MSRAASACAVVLATLALAAPAAAVSTMRAAHPTPKTSLHDVEDEVMCLVCGTPLNLAEAPEADRERAFIQRRIDAGDSKEQIKRRLEQEYGPRVLALPHAKGFNLAVYVIPIALLVIAVLALALTVPRWRARRAGPQVDPAPRPLSPAEARRLDDDLARFDL